MTNTSNLLKLLKKNKLSLTRPRRLVFELLSTSKEPLTIQEITLLLGNMIDRATVYRTIDLFEKLEIVKKVYVGFKYKIELGEIFQPHHHHVYCTQCGKTFGFEEPKFIEEYIDGLGKKFDVTITNHNFELEGTCNSCNK
ncbi:MAG: transcriptional repressor [Patescibacteria group bacterium]